MPGQIIDELLKTITEAIPRLDEIEVSNVLIGLGYTGVRLSTRHVGVSYTFSSKLSLRCRRMKPPGVLAGSRAVDLANLARSWRLADAVIGIATMNALSQIVIERRR